jgi:hypothetical protein
MAKVMTMEVAHGWSAILAVLEDEKNTAALMELLKTIYPDRMQDNPPTQHSEALGMIRDGFVYDVVREWGGHASRSVSMSQASDRYIQLRQAQATFNLTNKEAKALDLLRSVRMECQNFSCESKPIKQLHKTMEHIREELGRDNVPADWRDETTLHHFHSASALFALFQLNQHGQERSKGMLIHRSDPQWRSLAILECDKKLDQARSQYKPPYIGPQQKRGMAKYKGRTSKVANKFDCQLTLPMVKQCMETADSNYWKIQKELDAPSIKATTSL